MRPLMMLGALVVAIGAGTALAQDPGPGDPGDADHDGWAFEGHAHDFCPGEQGPTPAEIAARGLTLTCDLNRNCGCDVLEIDEDSDGWAGHGRASDFCPGETGRRIEDVIAEDGLTACFVTHSCGCPRQSAVHIEPIPETEGHAHAHVHAHAPGSPHGFDGFQIDSIEPPPPGTPPRLPPGTVLGSPSDPTLQRIVIGADGRGYCIDFYLEIGPVGGADYVVIGRAPSLHAESIRGGRAAQEALWSGREHNWRRVQHTGH